MIHFSCDCCGRVIESNDEIRYSVKIEIEAVMEPLDGEIDDDDRDHLMEISEILESGDDALDPMVGDGIYCRKRFDLCAECHRAFARSPVGKKSSALDFSNN